MKCNVDLQCEGDFYVLIFYSTTYCTSFFTEYNDAFLSYDSNHKGYLTKKEVTKTMRNLGFNPTDTDCQNIELEVVYKSK